VNIFSKCKRGEKCEYFFKSAKEEEKTKENIRMKKKKNQRRNLE
jgi:hypothetical protein